MQQRCRFRHIGRPTLGGHRCWWEILCSDARQNFTPSRLNVQGGGGGGKLPRQESVVAPRRPFLRGPAVEPREVPTVHGDLHGFIHQLVERPRHGCIEPFGVRGPKPATKGHVTAEGLGDSAPARQRRAANTRMLGIMGALSLPGSPLVLSWRGSVPGENGAGAIAGCDVARVEDGAAVQALAPAPYALVK